jgi:hypothetical protein
VLDHLSAQAAVAIRNAHLYRDSEHHRRRLMTLVDVTQRLTWGLDSQPGSRRLWRLRHWSLRVKQGCGSSIEIPLYA